MPALCKSGKFQDAADYTKCVDCTTGQWTVGVITGNTKCVAIPTPNPTPYPTSYPTPYPTPNPTPYPTPNPTPYPTPNPTPYPTPNPTPYPTPNPTPYPTPYPTPFFARFVPFFARTFFSRFFARVYFARVYFARYFARVYFARVYFARFFARIPVNQHGFPTFSFWINVGIVQANLNNPACVSKKALLLFFKGKGSITVGAASTSHAVVKGRMTLTGPEVSCTVQKFWPHPDKKSRMQVTPDILPIPMHCAALSCTETEVGTLHRATP
jgi:hypothetical protein